MRSVITRVLPVPAPATTSSGPSPCSTAARCAAFSGKPVSESAREIGVCDIMRNRNCSRLQRGEHEAKQRAADRRVGVPLDLCRLERAPDKHFQSAASFRRRKMPAQRIDFRAVLIRTDCRTVFWLNGHGILAGQPVGSVISETRKFHLLTASHPRCHSGRT